MTRENGLNALFERCQQQLAYATAASSCWRELCQIQATPSCEDFSALPCKEPPPALLFCSAPLLPLARQLPGLSTSPHYSREMRGQSQAFDIVHNYANGLFGEVFCNEISGPGVWWPGPISGDLMNYSG